jgi:hypothetical protein
VADDQEGPNRAKENQKGITNERQTNEIGGDRRQDPPKRSEIDVTHQLPKLTNLIKEKQKKAKRKDAVG